MKILSYSMVSDYTYIACNGDDGVGHFCDTRIAYYDIQWCSFNLREALINHIEGHGTPIIVVTT